jgi:tetratricopeptide (TPR) repeat protein
MSRSRWLGQVLVCASFGCQLVAANVHAQTPAMAGGGNATDASSNEYDRFVAQALTAYDAGRFAEARNSFRRAHELAPTARTLRTIGMCSFNLGDYVDALLNLEASLVETRKPLSLDQRSHVSDLIARSQMHVGRFKIRLSPPDAVLWADGRPPPQLTTDEILLEPGRHELLAQASGHQASRSMLQVDGGDRTTLEIVLAPSPAATDVAVAPTAAPNAAPGELPSPPGASSSATHGQGGANTQAVLGYLALGVGGVGLVAFGITTGLAASKESSLDAHCNDRSCEPAYHDDVDTYDRYKLLSTVSLVTGLAFAGAGVALLLTQPDGHAERASITPVLGIGAIGVRGQL